MTALTTNSRSVLESTSNNLDELVNQVRSSIKQVQEPKAQALLETTAEVLLGLKKAYQDYGKGGEDAWK